MKLDNKPELLKLVEAGFKPLPVRPGSKHPFLKHTEYRDRYVWDEVAHEFGPNIGAWSPLGSVTGWLVLDTDNAEALVLWRERLGSQLDATASVRTRKGVHFFWRLQDGQQVPGWTWESDEEAVRRGARFEVLGNGNGCMLPPSQHADDRSFTYRWVREPEHALPAPDLLLRNPKPAGGAKVTSTLAKLLDRPPEEGSRDNWLTQVAGHLAVWIPHEDAFTAILHAVNLGLPTPLDPEEVAKKVGVYHKQRTKPQYSFTSEAGWLVGTGSTIEAEAKYLIDGQSHIKAEEWADFDLKVKGVVDDDGERTYVVDLTHKSGRVYAGLQVSPPLFGRAVDLTTWLAARGASILPLANDLHKGSEGRRLLRYLDTQPAPAYRTVEHLGWTPGIGFVTHEGIATPAGFKPHSGVCPSPKLADWAPYHYGQQVPPAEAVQVLREVLTFQDQTVTSVFGAWWVMALLKGQFATSLFPFLALEAPSESGKTRGFFALMVALAGNQHGHGQQTMAAVRDMVAGHRNGIVWLDDLTDVGDTVDVIRQATSEGSRSKKGVDRLSTETVRLLCPMLISGEGLGSVMKEKAMRDRAIQLAVPSPIGRRSLTRPDRPQWDDILDLQAKYGGDLSRVAGSLLVAVLAAATPLQELRGLGDTSGRHDDKLSILRTGARVLAELTGDDSHISRVDGWCAEVIDEGAINLAIREIVPWALRSHGVPTSARGRRPAYVDDSGTVWVHVATLADQWAAQHHITARQRQLGDASAIAAEFAALNVGKGASKDATGDDGGGRVIWRYRQLPPEISRYVVAKATDEEGS